MNRFTVCVVFAIGLTMLAVAIVFAWRVSRAAWYSEVAGVVVSKDVIHSRAGRLVVHKPVIRYRYTVNDLEYTNDKFSLYRDGTSEMQADRIFASYAVGGACVVYYDEDNPAESYLAITPNNDFIIFSVLWLFLGITTTLGSYLQLRRRRTDT